VKTYRPYVKIFTYMWFSTLPTLATYVTWRWKSRVTQRPDRKKSRKFVHLSVIWLTSQPTTTNRRKMYFLA